MTNNGHLISVSHLTKVYHMGDVEVHALRGVTLEVSRGEFVAIMGASGSGKSTFMNVVGCLDTPTKGHYWLDGVDVGQLDKDALAQVRKDRIGFVFQGFNLLPRTSALENAELPLFYRNVSNAFRRERAMGALRTVGLEDRWHHLPNQLSGGQQQRVAIARALVNEPDLILADEPTGNLDSRTSVEVMDLFQRLNDRGITVIVVTHEQDIADYTKRIILFRDGRVRRDFLVERRKDAGAVLASLPPIVDEEEEAA